MSHDGYHTVLVLGGIRSGKSEYAEGLVADAPNVRYIATARADEASDEEWAARIAAHQARRPTDWVTEETGADPARLAAIIAAATPGETLLVDDLGGWLTAVLGADAGPFEAGWSAESAREPLTELAGAVASCTARLVIVSPEVGLSLVPTSVAGRAFTDAVGTANRALAALVDAVVLVVAGQPSWLKGVPTATPVTAVAAAPAVVAAPPAPPRRVRVRPVEVVAGAGVVSETVTLGSGTELPASADEPEINSRMMLPLPDETASAVAVDRLNALDVPGAGLGNLNKLIGFVAGTQGTGTPERYQAPRLMLVHGVHRGGLAAGDTAEHWQREVDRAAAGAGALGLLAAASGVPIQVVDVTAEPAGAIEDDDASTEEQVQIGLRQGFRLAEAAADTGTDLIILGAAGPGQIAAAAAVVGSIVGVEPAAVLPRVVRAGGRVDDLAWMQRCTALRDGLRRSRTRLSGTVEVLTTIGGYDLAVAAGIVLGATYRRIATMIDGPVGVAAGLLARDLGAQSRLWLLLADDGKNPAVIPGSRVLGASPFADLRLDLGEGAAALTLLPLIQNALLLSSLSLADSDEADADDAGPDGTVADASSGEAGSDEAGSDEAGRTGPARARPYRTSRLDIGRGRTGGSDGAGSDGAGSDEAGPDGAGSDEAGSDGAGSDGADDPDDSADSDEPAEPAVEAVATAENTTTG